MLLVALFLPWMGAAVLALLDGRRRGVGWLAVGVLGACLAALALLTFQVAAGGPVATVAGGWPAHVGIALRADALGLPFAVVSVVVLFAALVHEVLLGVHERTLPALVLFLAAGLTGLFFTADVFNFYVFFEVAMTASFVLASYGRREREVRAALVFAVVNLLGSAIFLSGVAALYHVTGHLYMPEVARVAAAGEPGDVLLVAALLFVALSLKLGLFPFHFWLPPIYRDAWPSVAAMLSGAVANIGSYGFLRFGADLLPGPLGLAAPVLLVLGALSLVYGAIQAVSVRTAGEMLAYSSIGQAGYILLALGMGGPGGMAAAVLYALVNALTKGLLFLATGLRGPLVGAAFLIGALGVVGVPPTAGFFGKAALFRAATAQDRPAVVGIIAVGAGLSLVYMFRTYQREFWAGDRAGERSPPAPRTALLGLALLVLALGLWPEPLLSLSVRAAAGLGVAATGAAP
jgi:multicomponent Na+:H+ antiporter subunit D